MPRRTGAGALSGGQPLRRTKSTRWACVLKATRTIRAHRTRCLALLVACVPSDTRHRVETSSGRLHIHSALQTLAGTIHHNTTTSASGETATLYHPNASGGNTMLHVPTGKRRRAHLNSLTEWATRSLPHSSTPRSNFPSNRRSPGHGSHHSGQKGTTPQSRLHSTVPFHIALRRSEGAPAWRLHRNQLALACEQRNLQGSTPSASRILERRATVHRCQQGTHSLRRSTQCPHNAQASR